MLINKIKLIKKVLINKTFETIRGNKYKIIDYFYEDNILFLKLEKIKIKDAIAAIESNKIKFSTFKLKIKDNKFKIIKQ